MKLENILLEETWVKSGKGKESKYENLKIVDFGSSHLVDIESDALIHEVKAEFSPATPYYMAPEMIGEKGVFNHKADIWSCGIIAYILLFSQPPYKGTSDEDIRQTIAKNSRNVPMTDDFWEGKSEDCKAFVRKLLTYDVASRPNAKKLLDPKKGDKWLRENAKFEEVGEERLKSLYKNFDKMDAYEGAYSDLKKATVAYIASQLISKEDRKHLSTLFRHFDKDGSGIIDKDELELGLASYYTKEEIDIMFQKVDTDGSKEIEFQEFLVAAMPTE